MLSPVEAAGGREVVGNVARGAVKRWGDGTWKKGMNPGGEKMNDQ